ANGAVVHQWEWNNGDNQKWRIEPAGDGRHRLIARHSGKALDIAGPSAANGAAVNQWEWNNGDNQKFRLEAVTG
ncbi:RICIN domain-containing protein, partial [Kitasatospora griseola]|uniref:RICIN domain-containing protein n=1 Tax=Kitasatospora griseola TaxID=2064 RepID=UPI001670E142